MRFDGIIICKVNKLRTYVVILFEKFIFYLNKVPSILRRDEFADNK